MDGTISQEQYDHIMAYDNRETISGNNSVILSADGRISGVVFPSSQTATLGSFAPAAGLMMAGPVTRGQKMQFVNIASYFRFVAPFDCSQVRFVDNASAGRMAGTVTLAYNAGKPTATVTANGTSSITLTGYIQGGQTYCIAILPQTFSQGVSVYFAKSDGTAYAKKSSGSCSLECNKVLDMGTPDLTPADIIDSFGMTSLQ